jgi:2-keto-4-pentenoate hydratase/2-oxohepta-3-ene-1,7-dioic acid hydratase in catechol pathway
MAAIGRHRELHVIADRCSQGTADGDIADVAVGPPAPTPRQVFGIGINYRDHAGEAGMAEPSVPLTFTKFPSCIAGPAADIPLSGPTVDWEVEIVAVVGQESTRVALEDAWDAIAGLTLGQDVSDRTVQFSDQPPTGRSVPPSFPSTRSTIPMTSRCGAMWRASACRKAAHEISSSRYRPSSPTSRRSAPCTQAT